MKGTIENLDVVIQGLDNAPIEIREAAFQGILIALNAAFKACATMLSPTDHTLKELALMGHPYSASHGFSVHTPDQLVHQQSGAYAAALEKVSPQGSFGDIIEGRIQIGEAMAELDRFIQEGTTHMRERPWMEYIVKVYGQDFADVVEARIQQTIEKMRRA
ncbi:MAG: hypothetical protein JWN27_2895 [Candidatus Eremiobacteraeota bacterium]|nr:hypothetical protein [Candidatus Eremiobacteraeota bacterium]